MKSFFIPSVRKFVVGSRCKVSVPEKFKQTHGLFHNSLVKIVSKKNFLARHVVKKIEYNKVICEILTAPNADENINVIGLEYPIRRRWLTVSKDICACDLKTVLMICGCKCGGC